eukprot:XP_012809600.1 PREDICTED: leukosialin [Xenopus tropicalis]
MGKHSIWCLVLCQCLWLWGGIALPTTLPTLLDSDSDGTVPTATIEETTDNQVQPLEKEDTNNETITDTPNPTEIGHANELKQHVSTQAHMEPEPTSALSSAQLNELNEPVQEKNDSQTTPSPEGKDLGLLSSESETTQMDTVTTVTELESTTAVSTSGPISTGHDGKIAVIDKDNEPTVSNNPTTKHDPSQTHGTSDGLFTPSPESGKITETGGEDSDPHPTGSDGLFTPSPESGKITKSSDEGSDSHSGTNHGRHSTASPSKDKDYLRQWLLITLIVIFTLMLITVIVVLVRKKRRSRSQNFSKRGKKGDGRDVWAGQVPQLGDGRAAVGADGLENGMAAPLLEDEQEMSTFVSGEKKGDSEIASGEEEAGATKMASGERMEKKAESPVAQEEQEVPKDVKPEMQPNGEAKEEQFPLPPVEQDLLGNEDKAI